jgi:hypothetical protein
MRMRRWIGLLALASVLLHAAALVRHNTVMAGAGLQYQALVDSLTQICHGSAVAGSVAPPNLPYVPPPSNSDNGCPLCSGLGPSAAIAAPEAATPFAPPAAQRVVYHAAPGSVAPGHAVCPPARGPPAIA